ncbi:MAG TPA: ATP-binding cassette domain-containing protein [Ktedonobacteraceae bacterium]|nr:ATP-binding cassette domain-containing protein [Ktedonobacteraceae bacterium]
MLTASLETHLQAFHLDLAFHAEVGKTTVLLGESGAGKSSVLRLLAGLIHPGRGLIELDGVVYFDSEKKIARAPQERPFGYVFQDYTLFPHLSVFENIAFGLRAQGIPGKLLRRRVDEMVEQMRLVGHEQQRPGQLSGGQQQRVALARALVLQPKLLLLDEPLSALDVQTKREVRQELLRILKQTGITTVLVTHQYLEALLFGQQILVLDQGKIIQRGTQRDLLQRPRSAYVAELVGMNFFRGRVVACEARSVCTICLESHSGPALEIQATLEEQGEGVEIGADAYIVIDPRAVTLSLDLPEGSARNIFRGEIVQILQADTYAQEGTRRSGWVRVSLLIEATPQPLIAEITEASARRLELSEGGSVYASFKAMEAQAYI